MGLLETLSDWTSDVCTDDSVRCHRHHLAHTDGCMVVRSLQDCCCHRWRRARAVCPRLAAPTWRGHRIGRYEWTSGRSEDTTGCVAASAVYLPLDLAKMPCDDLDGYRSRSRPAAAIRAEGDGRAHEASTQGKDLRCVAKHTRLSEPPTLAVTGNDCDCMMEGCKPAGYNALACSPDRLRARSASSAAGWSTTWPERCGTGLR